MKRTAIIFDLDGTIVETEHIWNQAMYDLLAGKNIIVNPADVPVLERDLMGLATTRCCQYLKDFFKLTDPVQVIIDEYVNRVRERYAHGVALKDGFVDFHAHISAHNLKTGIATSADDDTLVLTKSHVPLEQYFGEHIYNLSHVNNKAKPDPALYLYAADKLGVDPDYCVAIEDSATGVAAAKAAGMLCVGINTLERQRFLEQADVLVEHFSRIDLAKLLKK